VALLSTLAARWVKDRLPQSRVAAAIAAFLAALSDSGGTTSRNPASPQNRISARRMAPLAATPPATAMAVDGPAVSRKRLSEVVLPSGVEQGGIIFALPRNRLHMMK